MFGCPSGTFRMGALAVDCPISEPLSGRIGHHIVLTMIAVTTKGQVEQPWNSCTLTGRVRREGGWD